MERIARMAMEPVVEFGGTGRGEDGVETWGASLRRSESWNGGSERETGRACTAPSIYLEVALRTMGEPKELNRARKATASVKDLEARQKLIVNTQSLINDEVTYGPVVHSLFRLSS
jgi:hypothetical protein